MKSKKKIKTYNQFRKRIGKQMMPTPSEVKIFTRIYKEEMSKPNGEFMWALMLVYLAGKVKGAGITYEEINEIAQNMQKQKESHIAGNDTAFMD